MAAKVDSLKDEMEEALNKVEICKVGVVSSQEVFIGSASWLTWRTLRTQRSELRHLAWPPPPRSLTFVLRPAGPALRRLVQLYLERGRLRTLLRHGESL